MMAWHTLFAVLIAQTLSGKSAFTPPARTEFQRTQRGPVLSQWPSRSTVRRNLAVPLFGWPQPDKVQKWYNLLARPELLSRSLLQTFKVPKLADAVKERYVERQTLEAAVREHINVSVPRKYMIVVGPRGAGKTSLIRRVLLSREKVVYVQLTSSSQKIADVFRAKFGLSKDVEVDLKKIFLPFEKSAGADKPVVVVEIDSQVDAGSVTTQSQELKSVVSDEQLAHGILVLSDANAAFKLNLDEQRQRFLWVGDLRETETNAFLDKFDVLSTRGEAHDGPNSMVRRRLIDEIGTNAAFIVNVATAAQKNAAEVLAQIGNCSDLERLEAKSNAERAAVEDYCQRELFEATEVVKRSTTIIPTTQLIMRKLLASGDGTILPSEISDVSLGNLMTRLKNEKLRAVTYNSEAKRLTWYSKAHETAARASFEEEDRRRRARQWFGLRRFFMKKKFALK